MIIPKLDLVRVAHSPFSNMNQGIQQLLRATRLMFILRRYSLRRYENDHKPVAQVMWQQAEELRVTSAG